MMVKKILLFALGCILGGIILMSACYGIALTTGDGFTGNWHDRWDYRDDRTYNNTGIQTRELDSIRSLELGLVGEPVTIRRGGSKVTIEWSQSYDQQYDYVVNGAGDVLLERRETRENSFGVIYDKRGFHINFDEFMQIADRFFRWDWDSRVEYDDLGSSQPVTITIPEGMALDSLDIATVSGQVTLEDIEADEVDYAGVDGNIRLERCRVGLLNIGNVSGIAKLAECDTTSIEIGTVSGRLELAGGRCENVDIGGVNAELEVDRTESLRDVEIAGVNATARLRLPGAVGDYDLSAEGMNAELIVNGRSEGRTRTGRAGAAQISASGLNAVLRVDFDSQP